MASSKYMYKHGSSIGATVGRNGNMDDFLSTKDTTSSSKSARSVRGTGSAHSKENTANRIHLSSKQGSTSTRQPYDNYKGKVSSVSRTIVTDARVASPSSPESNSRTEPDTADDEMVKLMSLLSGLQKIDVERILAPTAPSSRTQEQLDKLQSELTKLKREYEALQEAYDSSIQKTQEIEGQYRQLQDNHEQLLTEAKQLIKDVKDKAASEAEEKVQNLKRQLMAKEDEIKNIRSEKDSALSRLSKEMGVKLNDNNAGIADLSDPNRSTKVAEKYNNLYDNDWTDALEELQNGGLDEETGVRFLLEIIKHVYKFCKNAKKEQLENLKTILDNPLSAKGRYDASPSLDETIDKNVKQMLESCIKTRTRTTISNLQKEYTNLTNKPRHADRLPDYTNNCIEVCWLMNTHSPPLVFAEPVASGQSYDKDLYREFTKQGDTVSFVVWLPLLIEEGGALLSKGVVQPVPLIRSEQKLQRYSRPGSAKTEPEPRTAWVTESSQMARGREKNTFDQDLQRRDESSNFGIGNRFDNLGNFGTSNSDEVSKNYQGGLTYTKNVDPHVDDMFNSTSASRPKYQNYSSHRDDIQSTNMPTYKQFTSKSDVNTVSFQDRSQNYSGGLRTEDRSLASRPSSSPVYKTRYTSNYEQGMEAGVHNDQRNTPPKIPGMEYFEVNGKNYGFFNNKMYLYRDNKWRLTNDI